MRVIYKAPGCAPEPRDIPNTLEDLQATVGGYIETVTIASDAVIICNEEGRLHGLPHNCRVFGVDEVTEVITEGSMPEDPPELPAEDEDEPEPVAFANPEPEPAPEPISEPEPVLEPEKIRPWNGFVHIRCEACHKESTTCLRTPTDTYICKECGHEMPLPKAYRAYTRCECGQKGAYLTNITDWAFDIPCVRCGSPNTVAYNPGRDCYGPVGSTQRRTKPRKKK